MRGFQRLASAARGTLWLLRATGLRDHFSKVENHLQDLDTKVLHVASQSATAVRVADNVQRLEKQISDVMTDVSSQHATTVRVAESVQRLGKHIVDVAANNLTHGRLSEQFHKLEKRLNEIGTGHLANGRLTEQFQKLERHIDEVAAHSTNGKLTEQFRRLEKHVDSVFAGGQNHDALRQPLQDLEKRMGQLADRLSSIEQRLKDMHVKIDRALAARADTAPDALPRQEQTRWLISAFDPCYPTITW